LGVNLSFKEEWLNLTRKVITPFGKGEIISIEDMGPFGKKCKVRIETTGRIEILPIEEVVIDSDYTVVRVINLSPGIVPGMVLFSNAKNYPTWEEARESLKLYSTNETLIALNFKERRFESNRILRGIIDPLFLVKANYHLIQAYFNNYWQMEVNFYTTESIAKYAWEERIENCDGTSEWIWLNALIDLKTRGILARAIFHAMGVIVRETYW
jgi:hypothetical protein